MTTKDGTVRGIPGLVFNPEKGGREKSLEAALAVMTGHHEVVDGKTVRVPPPPSVLAMPNREAVVEMLIGLIGLETAAREGRSAFSDYAGDETTPAMTGEQRTTAARRAWHIELVRLKLPAEVLKALRGL